MQPPPQAYWDPQRKEIQVVWGIGGRRRHFRLPSHPANLDVLTVEAINDTEVAVFYGREGSRPQWVQVVGIMSGGVHLSTNWQAYLSRLAQLAQQQQRQREQRECERQRREAEARAREQREQQRRALVVRPKAEERNGGANLPTQRCAPPVSAIRRDILEPPPDSSFYYDDKGFEGDDCGSSVSRQYAVAYDVTPKHRRSYRTGWTWLGGLLAFAAGLVGFVLSALAAKGSQVTTADAFAGLSALAVALFGLIGMVCPRLGGVAVLVFTTMGAGLTGSTGTREAMMATFVGGLMLWFGRRNRAGGTIRRLVKITMLAGVAALMIADHVPTNHGRPPVQNLRPQQSRPARSGKRDRSNYRK